MCRPFSPPLAMLAGRARGCSGRPQGARCRQILSKRSAEANVSCTNYVDSWPHHLSNTYKIESSRPLYRVTVGSSRVALALSGTVNDVWLRLGDRAQPSDVRCTIWMPIVTMAEPAIITPTCQLAMYAPSW